jgi:hypothetical protein
MAATSIFSKNRSNETVLKNQGASAMTQSKSFILLAVILGGLLLNGAAVAGAPSTRQVVFYVQ